MSRALTGSKTRTTAGWRVGLPVHRGATKRATWTFTDEAAADLWVAAGCNAIEAGQPLPAPAAQDLAGPSGSRPPPGTSFQTMADAWCCEYYDELRRGDPDRETTVRGHIARIASFMHDRRLVLETMVRSEVKALQASVARTTGTVATAGVPDGLDPDELVTMNAAVQLPGMASRATLKRRLQDGDLSAAKTEATGYLYRIGDLYSDAVLRTTTGGLRRGPRTNTRSLSQNVANDLIWVYTQVCLFAADHGVAVPQDRDSLKMHRTDKPASPDRQPVSMSRCADIAGRLHAVHQLALWLLRILGLRISEAYGIRVGEILDAGPGLPGAVTIKAQGGRQFRVRNSHGNVVTTDHVSRTKNRNSRRVLVVPPTLMHLIRTAIAVFHTDAAGNIDTEARLIPGLVKTGAGGQEAMRTALAAAAAAAGVDCTTEDNALEAVFSCTPHDMRRTVLSDLDRAGVKDSHIQRLAGHVPGTAVLHRHYLLDDPKLRPLLHIAKLVETELRAEVPNGLLVPTMVRCTTGHQKSLAPDAARIDAELSERNWLVVPDKDGDPLLSAAEVAVEMGITVQVARRWMAGGQVPSVHYADRARGQERRSRLTDVQDIQRRLRSQVTMRDIADEFEQPYSMVYQYVRANGVELQRWGQRDYVLPPATVEHLRAHYKLQAALHRRAVPLSVAVAMLNASPAVVNRLIKDRVLVEDEPAHDRRRMITRESVTQVQEDRAIGHGRRGRGPHGPRSDLVTRNNALAMTGLTDAELNARITDGVFQQELHHRQRHITRTTLLHYLVDSAPERLQVATAS